MQLRSFGLVSMYTYLDLEERSYPGVNEKINKQGILCMDI